MLKFGLLLLVLIQHLPVLTLGAVLADKIVNLPGLTFDPGFAQYSGYLSTPSGSELHYWLVESQSNPQEDPIVVWFNGGPGCSSLVGFLEELGPFRVNPDASTLFENVFSWNKGANVLFLESPRGVGFSYHNNSMCPDSEQYSDALTAEDNADALGKFFELYPEYIGRPFYITGESYGGVYLPTLTNLIIQRIMAGTLVGVNLRGMAIGNGILSEYYQLNSVVNLLYYRGIFGKDWYEGLRECCKSEGSDSMLSNCQFHNFISLGHDGVYRAKQFPNNTFMQQCANKVQRMVDVENENYTINDAYNTYQDCYDDAATLPSLKAQKLAKLRANLKSIPLDSLVGTGVNGFVDGGARINIWSTDAQYTYPCYMDDAVVTYLNNQQVRSALHIPDSVEAYTECSDFINDVYVRQNLNTTPVFQSIIDSGYPLRILIYNGDVDTVCNFLGDEWFIMDLAEANQFDSSKRTPWFYQQSSKYISQIGGYHQNFSNGNINIDLITVKGAGHFVPLDRGGPALQMITNFIKEQNYSEMSPYSIQRKPILPQYASTPTTPPTRKEAARIWNLPGLTYQLNFKQYSGYLNASTGNYLHYWFVESQRDPATDPLVLWLNGGPGCSSLGGLFTENGPFHPNPDGMTLFENVFSWNKGANVLYLESPRNVGFSYQNMSENLDPEYNDFKTARDNYLAIMDFLTVFPEYKNRPFYITGESYGGIYIPTLAAYCIDRIQSGEAKDLNLIGIAIGNGELSMHEQLNSLLSMLYYRGTYGYDLYQNITACSQNSSIPAAYFNYSSLVTIKNVGWAIPINSTSFCDNLMVQYGVNYIWDEQEIQDVYNINQDCYQQYVTATGSRVAKMHLQFMQKKWMEQNGMPDYGNQNAQNNYQSTDGEAGFYCYCSSANQEYLQQADVRSALHIPSFVQPWVDCSDPVGEAYVVQHIEMTGVFQHILNSSYPLNILIYNGDTDMACEFLGDEWFIEKLADSYQMRVAQSRTPWWYLSQIAGYWKRFQYSTTATVDLVTVKGAGHFVPLDRPGPALQMITNFITRQNYSTLYPYNTMLTPLDEQYKILQEVKPELTSNTNSKGTANRRIRKRNIQSNDQVKNRITKLQPIASQLSPFTQYAGYADVNGTQVYYWFIKNEVVTGPVSNSLLIWLGDGPGCSPVPDAFQSFGPYRLKTDSAGVNVYWEYNPYGWQKTVNIIYMDTPVGVGYTVVGNETLNDDTTAQLNKAALDTILKDLSFWEPTLYIGGRGYASVAALKLAEAIFKDPTPRLSKPAGVIIENGMLNRFQEINSLPNLMYFSGLIGKEDWDQFIPCCTFNDVYDNNCNLSQYVTIDSHGVVHSDGTYCGELVEYYSYVLPQQIMDGNEADNFYESCYITKTSVQRRRQKRQAYHSGQIPLVNNITFVDQAELLNYLSTDAFASYPCYMEQAINYTFNVDKSNLNASASIKTWQKCNPTIKQSFTQQYPDTTPLFKELFNYARNSSFRFVIYNGDATLYHNFIANQWFIENVARDFHKSPHQFWNFTESSKYLIQYAGYLDNFTSSNVEIDFLIFKGAGQYVALDRPLPAFQMITDILYNKPFGTIISSEQPVNTPTNTTPPQGLPANHNYLFIYFVNY